MPDHLGRVIARLRYREGLSQEKLAAALQLAGHDVSRDMIANIERGRVAVSVRLLTQIAQVLKVDEIEFDPSPGRPCKAGSKPILSRAILRVAPCRGGGRQASEHAA